MVLPVDLYSHSLIQLDGNRVMLASGKIATTGKLNLDVQVYSLAKMGTLTPNYIFLYLH